MPEEHVRPIVLVTGSSGLIGQRLGHALRNTYTLVGLDRDPSTDAESGYDWYECDVTRDVSVATALRRVRERHGDDIRSVVHLAAYYDFAGQPSPLYRDVTVEGTRRVLRELQPFNVRQFVFSSSLLVMKPVDEAEEPLTEQSPTEAQWDYPKSKLQAEAVIRRNHGSIPAVILRLAGVYDEDCHSIPLSQHIRRIYERKPESYFFPGDADHGQPFVHLDDLTACFRNVIERRDDLGAFELFLIAEPDVMSHQELQERLGELIHGRHWPTFRLPKSLAKVGAWAREKLTGGESFIKPWMIDLADDHYPVDIRRAQERLNWHPQHRLRETLDDMIQRLKSDPVHWYQVNGLPVPESLHVGV